MQLEHFRCIPRYILPSPYKSWSRCFFPLRSLNPFKRHSFTCCLCPRQLGRCTLRHPPSQFSLNKNAHFKVILTLCSIRTLATLIQIQVFDIATRLGPQNERSIYVAASPKRLRLTSLLRTPSGAFEATARAWNTSPSGAEAKAWTCTQTTITTDHLVRFLTRGTTGCKGNN